MILKSSFKWKLSCLKFNYLPSFLHIYEYIYQKKASIKKTTLIMFCKKNIMFLSYMYFHGIYKSTIFHVIIFVCSLSINRHPNYSINLVQGYTALIQQLSFSILCSILYRSKINQVTHSHGVYTWIQSIKDFRRMLSRALIYQYQENLFFNALLLCEINWSYILQGKC